MSRRIMQERRRHQRVRFGRPVSILIGSSGVAGEGSIENISSSGLMVKTLLSLEVGRLAGCEFSFAGSPLIDVPATVVSRVGDFYGLRFVAGPINQVMIDDALVDALARGEASTLGVHEIDGRKVLRITGGLHGGLENDFMHALTRVGVDVLDLAEVTAVDRAGLALCVQATGRYQANMGRQSACFAAAWKSMMNDALGGLAE
jgi:hypothetical protein